MDFSCVLIIIGLFGALFTAKQYERFRFHMQAAGLYRKEIEKKFEGGISNIRALAKSEHERTFNKLLVKLHLYYFWISFHILFSILGIILLFMTLNS